MNRYTNIINVWYENDYRFGALKNESGDQIEEF
jgi:hypothetical protein